MSPEVPEACEVLLRPLKAGFIDLAFVRHLGECLGERHQERWISLRSAPIATGVA
jgi:hypothetical protein